MTSKVLISALLPVEVYKKLEILSQRTKKSKSQIIEEALLLYFEKMGV